MSKETASSADLTAALLSLIASNSSVETPLQPVELFKGAGKGGRDVGSRFTIQPLWLD
jgi:hypothetical protein